MTKGAKIALGCGCLVLLVGVAIVVVFGVGAFWAKSKLHQVTGNIDKLGEKARQIETYEKKANANPYSAPADGVIPEARFVKFLDVRKQVYTVYERFKADINALEAKHKREGNQQSLSGALEATGKVAQIFTEARLAQVQALADVGMSEQEYRDIQIAVYRTAWAAESQGQSGKMPAESLREAERAAESQPGLSDEDRRKLHESMGQAAQALEVPKANVELFRKYEAEIKKYAMTGLELIGL
jgi:hypothetical protein